MRTGHVIPRGFTVLSLALLVLALSQSEWKSGQKHGAGIISEDTCLREDGSCDEHEHYRRAMSDELCYNITRNWSNKFYAPHVCCNKIFGPNGGDLCWDNHLHSYEVCCQGYGAEPLTYDVLQRSRNINCKGEITWSQTICALPFIQNLTEPERSSWLNVFLSHESKDSCAINPLVSGRAVYSRAWWNERAWMKIGNLCGIIAQVYNNLFRQIIRVHARNDVAAFDVSRILSEFFQNSVEFSNKIGELKPNVDVFGAPVLGRKDIATLMGKYFVNLPVLLLEDDIETKSLAELRVWTREKMEQISLMGSNMLEDALDIYAERIEAAGLFRDCGAACSDEWDVVEKMPGKFNDLIKGPVYCSSLLSNAQLWAGTDLLPPPTSPPRRWRLLFDEKGVLPDYKDEDMISSPNHLNTTCWRPRRIHTLIETIKRTQDGSHAVHCCGYAEGDPKFTADIFRLFTSSNLWDARKHIVGKSWLVLGSKLPWLEVLLLAAGASKVTTIDYQVEDFMAQAHPDIKVLTPQEFTAHKQSFDGAIQYSSIEHSGLGRYTDQLNPFADRQTVQATWCLLKNGAWFLTSEMSYFALDDLQDMRVLYNSGRAYGPRGVSRLFKNFRNQFVFRDSYDRIRCLGFSRETDIPKRR